MSTIQRMTLIGMYNYDASLFDGVILPEGYEKEVFINSLLLEHGEKCVLYTDVEFMKFALASTSRKWNNELKRIREALSAEYNPIWNYDRNEEYKDKTERKSGGGVTTSQPVSGTDESKVSAFNSSTYEPDRLTTSNAGTVKSESETGETGSIEHKAHLYGNIGVTTSAAMVKEETEMRSRVNMYALAGQIFANELLIQVY